MLLHSSGSDCSCSAHRTALAPTPPRRAYLPASHDASGSRLRVRAELEEAKRLEQERLNNEQRERERIEKEQRDRIKKACAGLVRGFVGRTEFPWVPVGPAYRI